MKKLFYILMIAFASAATFTSCTEEEVTPNQTEAPSNIGGIPADKM